MNILARLAPEVMPVRADTFDPLDWIARFEAAGGGFAGMGDNKLICWSLDHPPAQLQWLKTLHGEIKNDPAKVGAVKAALSAREVHHD